jgi:hypothetical protein
MKLFSLLFFLSISALASPNSNLVAECKKGIAGKIDSQDSLKFCSCFSDYILFKSPNFDSITSDLKKRLVKESALKCSSSVHISKSVPGWNDSMKMNMVKKCRLDARTNKITNELSDKQKELYCECYVDRVTKTLKLSDIKNLSQDKLMEKLAPKVIECKNLATSDLYSF